MQNTEEMTELFFVRKDPLHGEKKKEKQHPNHFVSSLKS